MSSEQGDGGVPSSEPRSPSVQLPQHNAPPLPQHGVSLTDPRVYNPVFSPGPPAPAPHSQPPHRVETYSRLRDDVQKKLATALVVRCSESAKYKSPVVILASEAMNLYPLLEQFFVPEVLAGAERFWKVVRNDMNMETWRPRVNGTQLKALANAHLPETEEQLAALKATVVELQPYMRDNTTADQFMDEYNKFLEKAELWWDGRTRREFKSTYLPSAAAGAGGGGVGNKRAPQQPLSRLGLPYKRPNMGTEHQLQGGGVGLYGGPAAPYDYYAHHSDGGGDPSGTIVSAAGHMDHMMSLQHPQHPASMGMATYPPNIRRQTLLEAPLPPAQPDTIIPLCVGGQTFSTTRATLLAVRPSWFYPLFQDPKAPSVLPKTPAGEFFIDRNGEVFSYVLEYLRSLLAGEASSPLPDDPREVHALLREAEFYQLGDLQQRLANATSYPQPKVRTYYDSLYLETGYNSIEGRGLKEMEQKKVVVMQQLNHVLMQKQADGFIVDWCKCGVSHREAPPTAAPSLSDGTQHNLFYHILLKKAVPVLHHMA